MFGRILAAGWVVFGGLIVLLLVYRRVVGPIPHLYFLKPILFSLIVASLVYGMAKLLQFGGRFRG
jgi:hypothetical protein